MLDAKVLVVLLTHYARILSDHYSVYQDEMLAVISIAKLLRHNVGDKRH